MHCNDCRRLVTQAEADEAAAVINDGQTRCPDCARSISPSHTKRRDNNRRRMTRNGITLKEHGDGTTHVILRRHTAGAVSLTVNMSSDAAADLICQSLGSGGTRNERVARVVAALESHR